MCAVKTATGERLKQARNQLDLTQAALAKPLGVPWDSIRDIETGRKKLSAELAVLIEKVHGIDLHWLLTGKGEMFLPKEEEETPSAHIDDGITAEVMALMGGLDEQGKQAVLLAARQAERITRLEKKLTGCKLK